MVILIVCTKLFVTLVTLLKPWYSNVVIKIISNYALQWI